MKTTTVTYDVERIRSISITTVAEAFGTVVRRGNIHFAICPWHDDNHPSLALYERTNENHCHCFVCGKGGSTIDFVMAQLNCDFTTACAWLSQQYNILTHEGRQARTRRQPIPQRKTAEPTPPAYIPDTWLRERITADNSFCRCLRQLTSDDVVQRITQTYRLGSFSHNQGKIPYVLFPSIDRNQRIHNIKCQTYDTNPYSPSFFHSDRNHSFWLGKSLQEQGIVSPEGKTDINCLFGEHLLPAAPLAEVVLVESPKNALLGSAVFPQSLWLAAGAKNMLKRNILAPLQGRRVIVYPDRDAIGAWRSILHTMSDLAYFTVSDFCERNAPADSPKYDIGDYIIDHLKTQNQPSHDEVPF